MSTKTLRKRIALVAVASLGFGLMSTVPASAAVGTMTAGSLAVKTGQTADASLKVTATGTAGLTPAFTITTRNSTVAYTNLQAVVAATYGAASDTYSITVSAVNTANTATLTNYRHEASLNTNAANSSSTRVLPTTFDDAGGTQGTPAAGITTTTLAATTAGAVYYIYIQEALAVYTAAADIKMTVTVYQTDAVATAAVLDTATTTYAGRVGQQVTITPTGDITDYAGEVQKHSVFRLATSITSQPAAAAGGTTVYPTISAVTSLDGDLGFATTGTTIGTTAVATSTGTAGDSASVSTINYSGLGGATGSLVPVSGAAGANLATVIFTPTVKGVYTLVVWNESSTSGLAALSGAESFQTFTINVVDAVTKVALSAINSTSAIDASVAGDDYGSLVKVTLTDAGGNLAIPATGETVILTPSSSTGDITYVNNVAVTSAKGAAYSLSAADFGNTGVAYVNITNTAAATWTVVATYSGSASGSVSLTSRTVAANGDVSPIPTGTSGWVQGTAAGANDSGNYDFPVSSASGSFYVTSAYSSTTASYVGFLVTDTNGYITGLPGAIYAPASTVVEAVVTGVAGGAVSISWTGPSAATGALFLVENLEDGYYSTVDSVATTNGTVTPTPAIINAVPGATTVVSLNLKDNFKRNRANQTLTAVVTGRNPTVVNRTVVTDSLGNASFSFVDANTTSVITSDSITVTGGSSAVTASILYGTVNAPSTITLTSTGDTDVIAGTTTTDIDASATGATGTSATASALVKNSAGSAVAGVAVVFTVTGLVGAEVHTTKATVYTDATGTAVSNISSYAAGKATVTATAGTATASDDIYFAQNTPLEARTIAISAVGGLVKATVKDRYGNPIKNVTVDASRTGTGYFGAGASSAQGITDSNGEVEFNFIGAGTVKVAFTATTYGQSYAAAGYDFDAVNGTKMTAAAAGTAATNQAGLGAALAPVGINSASLAVEGANVSADNASAAADAAAEATDAANAATDAANAAAEAADAATAAAQDAADAVAALSTQVTEMVNALKKQITALTNLVIKIQKKVKA